MIKGINKQQENTNSNKKTKKHRHVHLKIMGHPHNFCGDFCFSQEPDLRKSKNIDNDSIVNDSIIALLAFTNHLTG